MLNFFGKKDEADIDQALTKTRGSIFGQIGNNFRSSGINEDTMEELEDILISCNLGFRSTNLVLDQLRERSNEQRS